MVLSGRCTFVVHADRDRAASTRRGASARATRVQERPARASSSAAGCSRGRGRRRRGRRARRRRAAASRSAMRDGVYEMDLQVLRNRESLAHGSASWDAKMNELFGVWLNPVVALAKDPAAARGRWPPSCAACWSTSRTRTASERVDTIETLRAAAREQERAARAVRQGCAKPAHRRCPKDEVPERAAAARRAVVRAGRAPAHHRVARCRRRSRASPSRARRSDRPHGARLPVARRSNYNDGAQPHALRRRGAARPSCRRAASSAAASCSWRRSSGWCATRRCASCWSCRLLVARAPARDLRQAPDARARWSSRRHARRGVRARRRRCSPSASAQPAQLRGAAHHHRRGRGLRGEPLRRDGLASSSTPAGLRARWAAPSCSAR